jgi:nicotinate-nucleotide pyrophosphorylase (carboxylating)
MEGVDMTPSAPPASEITADVERALREDLGSGDVSAALLPGGRRHARVLTRQDAVLAGSAWFDACFAALDPQVTITWHARDGARVAANSILCDIVGDGPALVSAERSALNFLQLLSATATRTRAYVDAVAGTGAVILDTRKTIPGLRVAQKYAVRCGGGSNHRMGLFDAVMLKENHILACGGIAEAVARARLLNPGVPVIVETENLDELVQALESGPDRILLDEFDLGQMREAVRLAHGRCPLEASGGVDLNTIRAIAETGVQCISVGSLTKHVQAIDLSLRLLDD